MSAPWRFPQFTLKRLEAALARINGDIWHSPVPVRLSKASETEKPVPLSRLKKADFKPVHPPIHWGRLFQSTWFRLDLPRTDGTDRRYLRWRDQGEATLYVDGLPHYGFDVGHRCAPLPEKLKTIHVESICCQSAIWHPGATGLDGQGSRLDGAEIIRRNDDAWHAWHDLVVLKEILVLEIEKLPEAPAHLTQRPGVRPPFRDLPAWVRSLIEAIDTALDAFDRDGLRRLRAEMKSLYGRFPAEWTQLPATMIGHAHIDLVWMWPERTGESKAVHTFSTALRLMDEYPEFRFSYSQPASYEAVARLAPALGEPIRKRVKEKRWELLGAAYVESDTVLSAGEPLLRSLLIGQDSRSPWTDKPSRILWLPDVFGYAGCLPRLMQMAGIEWFFTNKVAWRRVTHFPHSSFRWRGTDGTEVLAHVSFEVQQCYNGTATVRELQAAVSTHKQANLHPEAIVPTGFGDGGGGPTEEMCERARRMANLVSVPQARWGTVEPFFERMAESAGKLPVWSGEIYLEMHRGTYTTQSSMKAAYRAAERGLQTWEAAQCAVADGAIDVRPWKRVVFAQFHDALPGSSFHETYAEMVPELAQIGIDCLDHARDSLSLRQGKECLFNPLPQSVVGWVDNAVGAPRPVLLPPLGSVSLDEVEEGETITGVKVGARTLSNDRTKIVVSSSGEIESLTVDGSTVALSEPAGSLWMYPDHPHDFNAWEIDLEALRLGVRIRGGRRVASSGDGSTQGVLTFERKLPDGGGRVAVTYRLRSGEPFVRISLEVDWQKPETLLRWVCPTDYRGAMARFGAPFGSVLRPQLPGQPAGEAYWESPASRWAMVADDGETEGLFAVTEAKYGFEVFDGRLAVTLLRSPIQNGEQAKDAGSAPSSLRVAGRSRFTDLGSHRIEMALGRFDPNAPRSELPASLADTLFTLPLAYRGEPVSSGLIGIEGGDSLVPGWAKPISDKRWLLRLHETLGRRGRAEIVLEPGYSLESVGPRDTVGESIENTIEFGPYQILSVIVRRSRV